MMRDTEDTFILLGAYQDGELSPREALDLERRLAAEPELRRMLADLGGLSGAVRAALDDDPAPEDLHERVMRQAGLAAPKRAIRPSRWREGRALAASLVLGVALGGLAGGATMSYLRSGGRASVEEAVLAAHLRGLAAPQPFDIASSDRHVVKPWFNGRTTVAPSAPDLADKGFPLLGGRVDVVDGKTVPTLVYRHDRHVISVTIVPRGSEPLPSEDHRDGSTVLTWTAGDLAYYVVSDLNTRDLRSFADQFRQAT